MMADWQHKEHLVRILANFQWSRWAVFSIPDLFLNSALRSHLSRHFFAPLPPVYQRLPLKSHDPELLHQSSTDPSNNQPPNKSHLDEAMWVCVPLKDRTSGWNLFLIFFCHLKKHTCASCDYIAEEMTEVGDKVEWWLMWRMQDII